LCRGVQVVEGLVEQQHAGLQREGAREGQAPQLAAGEPGGAPLTERAHAEVLERIRRAPLDLLSRKARGLERHAYVVLDGAGEGDGALEDHGDAHPRAFLDSPLRGRLQIRQRSQQGALAGTVATEHGKHLAIVDLQRIDAQLEAPGARAAFEQQVVGREDRAQDRSPYWIQVSVPASISIRPSSTAARA